MMRPRILKKLFKIYEWISTPLEFVVHNQKQFFKKLSLGRHVGSSELSADCSDKDQESLFLQRIVELQTFEQFFTSLKEILGKIWQSYIQNSIIYVLHIINIFILNK